MFCASIILYHFTKSTFHCGAWIKNRQILPYDKIGTDAYLCQLLLKCNSLHFNEFQKVVKLHFNYIFLMTNWNWFHFYFKMYGMKSVKKCGL